MNRGLLAVPVILLALLAALWSGLSRSGWNLPLSDAAGQHGHFMVNCFLASLIFLERAVTMRQWWIRLLPLGNAVAVVPFLMGENVVAQWLLIAGSTGFLLLCCWFVYCYHELYYYVFVAAAASLVAGNVLLLRTSSYPSAAGWWICFLLFTIVAERLELSKFLPRTALQKGALLALLALVPLALALPAPWADRLLSFALAATGCWLLRFDMARRALRSSAAHRYSAVLLLTGFGWLIVVAALLVFKTRIPLGYDAVLHGFFIGFVFSMIFAHAPIILPALLKKRIAVYHRWLYVPFALLQASLLLRICADVCGEPLLRKWAASGNGLAIVLFAASVAIRVRRQLRSKA
ncbi:MAG: hypothetical protein EOO08_01295 [Chitinophagaceae bacterium]|nr:MAG: hypothetical protein EOO08_01295 [Chitinophagaceae bacterium]